MLRAIYYRRTLFPLFVMSCSLVLVSCTSPIAVSTNTAAESTSRPRSPGTVSKGYKVQPGDRLFISVWREETLQREVIVPPDGNIRFPLAGEIDTTGLSLAEIEKRLSKKLTEFIPDPAVSVSLMESTGNLIYVVGRVAAPGQYVLNRNIDVVQALALAGGMTPFAKRNGITILRVQGGQQSVFHFNYEEIEKGQRLSQNILLMPGDTIVVP